VVPDSDRTGSRRHGNVVRWFGTSTDIEELKRAEKELRDLVDYVPELIVIRDPDGRSKYANRATLDYLGRTFEEFIEPGFDQTVIHPDDWDTVLNTRRQGSRPVPYEYEARMMGMTASIAGFCIASTLFGTVTDASFAGS